MHISSLSVSKGTLFSSPTFKSQGFVSPAILWIIAVCLQEISAKSVRGQVRADPG